MRYVFLATMAVFAVSAPSVVYGQNAQDLSIVNYRFVGEQRVTLTTSNVTYIADIANAGVALASATATVTSLVPSVQPVKGQDTLKFGPVPFNTAVSATNTFTLLVDRTVPFDFANLKWTFQAVRLAPIANAGPSQTANVGNTVTLNGSGSTNPSGIGTLSYAWAFTTRPSGSVAALSNPTSVFPTFVPDVAGNYIISLTVSNGAASDTASVTVSTTLPPPPVANAGANQTVNVGTTVVLDGSKSTSGSGKPLTYAWTLTSRPNGSTAFLTGANTVSPTFIADKLGTYTAQLIVNDTIASSTPSSVTITTQVVKPVANAGPNQLVTIGSVVQLNGSGSTDANGLPLTYQWSLISLPSGSAAVLTFPTAVNPTFTADRQGDYIAQLIVSNGVLSSDPVTVTITTKQILKPNAVAGPNQTVTAGSTVQLDGSGSNDPQNLPLTYQWAIINKPAGSAASLSSAVIPKPVFVADLVGSYVIQLTVNNGFLPSDPATVTISTTCAPPTANAGPAQNVLVGATVTLDGSASGDACKDPLTYSWSFTTRPAGSSATLSGATTVSPTFVADVAGVFVAQLIVNNGFSNSTPATVMVTASPKPSVGVPANTSLGLGLSTPFAIVLTQAAPAGGVTVNLASDSPNVTIPASVTIPAGATQPSPQPQVTGAAIGSANITATATGYIAGTGKVTVTAPTMAFSGSPLSVNIGTTASLNLNLTGGQAPAGGLTVNLVSSDPSKATVPASVNFVAGATSAVVPVTGVAVTSAPVTITASSTGLANATASVNVIPPMIGVPANVTETLGQSVAFPVTLAQPAPAGGILLTLVSSDTTKVTLSQPNIFVAEGQTQPGVQAQVIGAGVGSATITVSASGFPSATGTVTVTAPTMAFTGSPLSVSVGATGTLNLTLTGGQAPPKGLDVSLVSSDPAKASVPSQLTFTGGATVLPVTVTGVALTATPVTITASVAGIPSATASVTVTLPVIGVPSTTTLGLGKSATFALILPQPAAADVTINLSSSDAAKATILPATVTVLKGQTMPPTQPQVTGAGIGSATITAAATGYASGAGTVTVTAPTMSFSGSPLSVPVGSTGNLTLNLTGGQAPAGGLTVNLTSSDTTLVTVPSTVSFAAGATSVPVPVTGVAVTTTSVTVTASAAGLADATASVKVTPPLTISVPANTTVGLGQSVALPITLSQAAPAGGLTVNLASSDSAKVSVTPASVVIAANATQPATQPQVTGLVAGASATITASSSSATSGSGTVTVSVPTMSFTGSPLSINVGISGNLTLNLTGGQAPTGGLLVTLSSSDSAKATVQGSVTIPAGATSSGPIPVTGAAQGQAIITASATGLANATATVNVGPQLSIGVSTNPSLNLGQTAAFTLTLAAPAPAGGITVNLASSDPSKVSVTPSSVTIPENATQPAAQPQIKGLNFGSSTITASATNYTSGSQAVQVSGTISFTPASLTINGAQTQNLTLTLSGPAPAGGITINLSSSNTAAATVPATVTFAANATTVPVPVKGVAIGSTVIHASSLPNLADTTANVTVNSDIILASNIFVQPGQTVNFPVSLANPAPAGGVFITLNVSDSSILTLLSTSVYIEQGQTQPAAPPQIAGVKVGSVTITASSSGYMSATQTVQVSQAIPASMTANSGTGQSTLVNTAFPNPLVVTVKDASNNPVSGVTVTFTGPASGAGLAAPVTAVTNASGLASAAVTANATAGGPYTVTATAGSASATFQLTNNSPAVGSVTVLSGSPQSAQVNTVFANPLLVTVKDTSNNPLGGVTVTFAGPASGAGIAAPVTATTNASGTASATVTANGTVGGYTVAATAGAFSANFSLNNTPPPPASITANSGGGQSALINNTFAAPLVVTVKDASNNPIGGVTVTFSGPASGASIVTTTAVTNASGVASATVTANGSQGTYSVTATAGAVSTTFSQMTNTLNPPASITVNSGGGQSAPINTAFAAPISVTVKDASNNPIAGVTVSFAGPNTGASIVSTTATTNASGVATATVTANATAGGPYTVTATADKVSATLQLTNTTGPVTSLTVVSGSGQTTGINSAFGAPLVVTAKDAGNNLVSGATVTFTGPASGAGINPATVTATTNASGVASATVSANGTVGGPYNVTAASGTGTATFSLTNLTVPPASITVNSGGGQSTQISTAFAAPISVTVKDAGNNPLSGVTVSFAGPVSGASIVSTTATTNASGVATATLTANATAGGPYDVTATAGSVSKTFQLTNTPGPPASVTVNSGGGQSATVGTAFANPLSVTVKDAGNNLLSGVTVTFAGPVSGASIVSTTATTNASGVATATVTANTTAGGPYNVTATAGSATSAPLQLTNTPSTPASMTVNSGNNQSAATNQVFGAPLSVTVKDSFNNPVASGVTVTFTGPASGAGIAPATVTAITNASGVASTTVTANSTVGGPYNVTATAGAASATFSLTNLQIQPASVTVNSGSGQSAQINATFANPLSVTVKDASNNPVPGYTVNFASTAPGAGIVSTTATTNASGVASATVTANATAGGPYAVTATAGPASANFSLTNTPGPPTSMTVNSGSGQSTGVNTPFGTPLSVTVKDAGNNLLNNVTVTFTGPASGASINPVSVTATTNASGVATATVTANGTAGGPYTVTATAGSASGTFQLTNNAGSVATLTVNSGSGQSTTVNTAFGTQLSVTAKDASNNVVSGATVTFTGPVSGAGIAATVSATTNASGVATATVTANTTAGGPYNVTAASGAASATFSLTNNPGQPASMTVNSGNSQSTTVNAAFATPLSVTVKDSFSNPISGVTVTFAGPASGASITPASVTATTNASGVASTTVTANGTAGGPYNVTATAGSATANFSLTNTAQVVTSLTVNSGSNQSATVNTAFGAPLSVTAKDASNNLVAGATVTFTGPASGAGIAPVTVTATTNASGVATATVTANTTASAASYTVTASAGTASATFSLTNNAGAPSSMTVNTGSGQSTTINSVFGTPLAVTVKDAFGNLVANGTTVTYTGPASGASTNPVSKTATTTTGVASTTVTANGTVGGPYTVTASAGSANATFQLTNTQPQVTSLTVNSGSGQSTVVNTAFGTPLSVTARDASNNLVAGATVTFTGPASGAGIAPVTVTATTNASGVATVTVTANTTANSLSYNVVATSGTGTASFTLTNNAGPVTSLTVNSGSGQSTGVNSVFATPLSVTAKDSFNNLVSGATVTYTGPASGASTNPVSKTATTNASGVASATVTANGTTGTYTVTATSGTGSAAFTLTNTVPPVATLLPISGGGQTAVVNTQFLNPLVVSARDASNNPLSGVTVTFAGPGSGASIVTTTAVSDASGNASAFVTANGTVGGPYNVTATAVSNPLANATFTGMNNILPIGSITATATSVGRNLETTSFFTLSAPAGSGGLSVKVTSSDASKLLVAAGPNDAGAQSATVNVAQGMSTGGVWLQGLVSSGTATITVSAVGYSSGQATITLTPSGILMAGPFGQTTTITTNVGAAATTLTLNSARLDASLNLAEIQAVRGGYVDPTNPASGTFAASVTISNSAPTVGTVGTPVTISAGSSSATSQFTPGPSTGTTTLIAVAPTGFSTPVSGNVVTANVNAAVISCTAASVGNNLQALVSCSLVGGTPSAGKAVILSSDDISKVMLAPVSTNGTTCTAAGSSSITLNTVSLGIPPNNTIALPSFCVYGLASSGTTTYTINGSSMGYASSKGNVTLTASGFVISPASSPIGTPSYNTLFTGSSPVPVNVWSAQLDASGNYLATEPLAGGVASVTVNVTSGTPSVGTITSSPVLLAAGSNQAITNFQPLSGGSSVISLGVPAGYATPTATYRTVTMNVPFATTTVNPPLVVGQNLQDSGTVILSPTPTSPVTITITSQDPNQLLLSSSATTAGAASATITIPANTSSGTFFVQALGGVVLNGLSLHNNTPAAGSISWDAFQIKYQGVTYTIVAGNTSSPFAVWTPGGSTLTGAASVTAPALLVASNASGTATGGVSYTITPASIYPAVSATTAIVPSGVTFSSTFLFTTVGAPASPVALSTAALDPATNQYSTSQALRAGAPTLQVTVQNSSPSVGTITSPVSITAGTSSGTAQFTPVSSGITALSIVTPSGFVGSSNKTSLTAIVQ